MRLITILLGITLIMTALQKANGQYVQRADWNLDSISFESFSSKAEKVYAVHFYYDSSETKDLLITIHQNQATLKQVLDKIFSQTIYHYAADESGNVFITSGTAIKTVLPSSLFDPSHFNTNNQAVLVEPELKNGQNLKVASENKLYEIGKNTGHDAGKAILTGYIRDIRNGEAIAGATLYIDSPYINNHTDQFGYYSLTLPKGWHVLKISSMGKKDTRLQIALHADGKLNIELSDFVENLKEVVVYNKEKSANVKSMQMGVSKLSIKAIKLIPVVFGETDILKVVLTLPGVTSVGEASSGFNVRGGSTDQNLILFNDATIYNPSHLFGFFSAFDPDIVKSIELYKSSIPEKFGGRLSSVLYVTMKDGNSKTWTGVAGISPLTSKITLEGPLNHGKTTVIIGGRTTYSDWILHSLPNAAYNKSNASFYDLNLHISHTIDSKNYLYLTGYLSRDNFNFNNDTAYKYGNSSANIKWRHIFNGNFYGVVTAGLDRYDYGVSSQFIPVNGYNLGFDINQKNAKADFNYKAGEKHAINFGISTIHYLLHPGTYTAFGLKSVVAPNIVPREQALESALYLGDTYAVTSKFSVNAGIRYSIFNYLGPHDVYQYQAGVPKSVNTIMDTLSYASGKIIKTYMAPEIRLSMKYELSASSSFKLSFNTLRQYIHMLSNTTAISPTDIWKLSDPNIQPQIGEQISAGYYKNLKSNTIETSIEVYYKNIYHYLDYKSGADLVLNHHIETEVINSKGKAYGIELLIRKTAGKLNGWFSYTYSRTFLKSDDPSAGQAINNGNYYPADFDKPHSVNFIGNYQFSHRISLSGNVVYSTGRPITLPLATFNIGGATSLYYSERNQYRIPDYFRSDISLNLDGNHKIKQKIHNSWSLGIYNLTARQNAYSVYFVNVNGHVQGYQLSIFGTLIPFITYNLKF